MKKLNILLSQIKEKGLKGVMLAGYSLVYDLYYDAKYGVDTYSWLPVNELDVDEHKKEHAVLYQATRVLPLRKLLKRLNITKNSTIVDIGSGKGRVLLLAAEFGFTKVKGIEFSPLLCSIAEKNIKKFKQKTQTTTVFQVINDDAANYQYEDNENVFFLYNPFDEVILEQVLENITASLKRKNRRVWMIYANAQHSGLIEKKMKIINTLDFVFLEFDFIVYEAELLSR
jgi:SAM-dependent methyltransferase